MNEKKQSNIDLLMESLAVAGKRIIDIGCGDGDLSHRMAAAGAQAVLGLDPNPKRVDKAGANAAANERFEIGEGQTLPSADASQDIAVFFNSLHHVPVDFMDRAIAEAARVLKPQGVLYVSEPVAAGSFFEAMRPVNDESAVRQAAIAALKRAVARGLFREERETVNKTTRIEKDFDSYRERMVDANPTREAMVREREAEIRERFFSIARKTETGYELEQLTRANIYVKAG